MTPQRRFRHWVYGDVVVEIPSEAPYGTLPPKDLADVPPEWKRRPVSPLPPQRPGRR